MTFDGVLALWLSTWRTCICGVLYQYIVLWSLSGRPLAQSWLVFA